MVCRKAATYYRPVLFIAPNSISRLKSAASPLWGAILHAEIARQVTEFVVNCVTSFHSQPKLRGARHSKSFTKATKADLKDFGGEGLGTCAV